MCMLLKYYGSQISEDYVALMLSKFGCFWNRALLKWKVRLAMQLFPKYYLESSKAGRLAALDGTLSA